MEHARTVFQTGVRDYRQISGASGPIAYPAGYLYIFEGIRRFTGDGHKLPLAQTLFALLYLIQLTMVFLIYWTSQVRAKMGGRRSGESKHYLISPCSSDTSSGLPHGYP